MPTYTLNRKLNENRDGFTVDCREVIAVLTQLQSEIVKSIQSAKAPLLTPERYKKSYVAKVKAEVKHADGYVKALSNVKYMLGWDHYFSEACDDSIEIEADAFAEIERGILQEQYTDSKWVTDALEKFKT